MMRLNWWRGCNTGVRPEEEYGWFGHENTNVLETAN